MSQIPKTCPAFLTPEEWDYVLNRDGRQCSQIEICRASGRLGQADHCSYKLDVDHHHPVEYGGDDSWTNVRLLCEGPNRGRPVEPTPYWDANNFWDEPIAVAKLREIQKLAGYEPVLANAKAVTDRDCRQDLLKRITLLPGVTGIGKTVLAQGVLFAINEAVNAIGFGRPRVRRVLWLSPERTLRDSAAIELREDAYEYGIITHRQPRVATIESSKNAISGPGDYDICVSCPHILWDVSVDGVPRVSQNEMRKILSFYDTIIFDEVDWAGERVRQIALMASHALKFALTASPPVVAGVDPAVARRFLGSVVMISEEAVGDYQRASILDGCLKKIDDNHPTGYIATAAHDRYDVYSRGERGTVIAKASLDHPVFISTILHAVVEADHLEKRMILEAPQFRYSPHIIVRFDRIEDVIAAYHALNNILPGMPLENKGWRATAIFQGHMRKIKGLSADEADLTAKKGSLFRHPFMRAKNNNGVADENCARILLMCQIGIRGINNWPIQSAVDCTEESSISEDIQFDYGRPIRLPPHLAKMLESVHYADFVRSRIYLPQVSDSDARDARLLVARSFILNMKGQMEGRFWTWENIINRDPIDRMAKADINPAAPPFSQEDKFALMDRLGKASTAGVDLSNPDEVETIVSTLRPEPTGARRERAEQYVDQLLVDKNFRDNEVLATEIEAEFRAHPEIVITQLKPQDDYTIDQLRLFVLTDVRMNDMRDAYLQALADDNKMVIHSLSMNLHTAQVTYYREPPVHRRLQGNKNDPGALREIASELAFSLFRSGAMASDEANASANAGKVIHVMNIIAARFFAVDNAQEGGPMDHHAYHVAILGRCRRKLQSLTRAKLVRDGLLVGMKGLADMP